MNDNYELKALQKRYSENPRKMNSFYEEMSPMPEPAVSAKFIDNFATYGSCYPDSDSNNLMKQP